LKSPLHTLLQTGDLSYPYLGEKYQKHAALAIINYERESKKAVPQNKPNKWTKKSHLVVVSISIYPKGNILWGSGVTCFPLEYRKRAIVNHKAKNKEINNQITGGTVKALLTSVTNSEAVSSIAVTSLILLKQQAIQMIDRTNTPHVI